MARLTLNVPDHVKQSVERMKVATDAASLAEVVRRAASLYEHLLEATAPGAHPKIAIKYDDGRPTKEVVLFL